MRLAIFVILTYYVTLFKIIMPCHLRTGEGGPYCQTAKYDSGVGMVPGFAGTQVIHQGWGSYINTSHG